MCEKKGVHDTDSGTPPWSVTPRRLADRPVPLDDRNRDQVEGPLNHLIIYKDRLSRNDM